MYNVQDYNMFFVQRLFASVLYVNGGQFTHKWKAFLPSGEDWDLKAS